MAHTTASGAVHLHDMGMLQVFTTVSYLLRHKTCMHILSGTLTTIEMVSEGTIIARVPEHCSREGMSAAPVLALQLHALRRQPQAPCAVDGKVSIHHECIRRLLPMLLCVAQGPVSRIWCYYS